MTPDATETIVGPDKPTARPGIVSAKLSRPPAPETVRLYASDWAAFRTWCRHAGEPALPAAPATLAAYLAAAAGRLSPGALARRLAIVGEHRRHGHASPGADPAVKVVFRGARRSATRRCRPSLPAAQLARMAIACPGDLAGRRDRALFLLTADPLL